MIWNPIFQKKQPICDLPGCAPLFAVYRVLSIYNFGSLMYELRISIF